MLCTALNKPAGLVSSTNAATQYFRKQLTATKNLPRKVSSKFKCSQNTIVKLLLRWVCN